MNATAEKNFPTVRVTRIVSVLSAALLGVALYVAPSSAWAQSKEVFSDFGESDEKSAVKYVLPKQKLTGEITANQILSDLALNRGQLKEAFQGYVYLAQKTRDPRYAERAYIVGVLANDPISAAYAATLLKQLAPNAVLGQGLIEQLRLAEILKKADDGQLERAFADTEKFLQDYPKHEVGLTLLADLASKLNRADALLRAFEQLYAIAPNDPEAMNNLGYYLADHNIRLKEADKLISGALKRAPKSAHILDSAAWLAYRQGNLTRAEQQIRQSVALAPEVETRLHMAEILWAADKRDEAQSIFNALKAELKDKDAKDPIRAKLNEALNRLQIP